MHRLGLLRLLGLVLFFAVTQTLHGQLNRGVSVKAYPRGTTPFVDVKLPPLDGSIVLRLPELISDMDHRLVYSETNLKQVNWVSQSNGTINSSWRQDGLAAYQLSAMPEQDGLHITWTITNLQPHAWSSSLGAVCMQSQGVPALYDALAERTFLHGDGQWSPARTTWRGEGGNWYLPAGKGPLGILQPYIADGSWKVCEFHPDEGLIAVRSIDGNWVLAQAWHQGRLFIVNVHDHYACTDVCADLGDIAAGETVRIQGKIYLFRGSLDDLESKYKADLDHKKIDYQHHYK